MRAATAGLAAALLAAPGAFASLADYPFHVETRPTPGGQEVAAVNQGPAPVWLRLSLQDARNVRLDRAWPVTVLVPPGATRGVAALRAADPAQPFSYGIATAFSLGDPHAIADASTAYRAPFPDGDAFRISQAPGGRITTHAAPAAAHAVDIVMPEGTPVMAARAGVVIDADLGHRGGGAQAGLAREANVIQVLHRDGTIAVYAHLRQAPPLVAVGQRVRAGQQIAWSGNTGYSSGPHLHFAVLRSVLEPSGHTRLESIPFRFAMAGESFAPYPGMLLAASAAPPGRGAGAPAPEGEGPGPLGRLRDWARGGPLEDAAGWLESRSPLFWPLAALEALLVGAMAAVFRRLSKWS